MTLWTEEGRLVEDVLDTLLLVIEAKDAYTGDHCRRVSQAAGSLALACGWSSDEVEDVRRSGLIHDLGKLSVPDRILCKPEPLRPEEYELMRGHPFRGFSVVQNLRGLSHRVKLGVLYHHERWDGKGYPNGLKAEGIPRVARVLAVADAWDALVHDRPYQVKCGPREALAEIRAHAGAQFDPAVVAALGRLWA